MLVLEAREKKGSKNRENRRDGPLEEEFPGSNETKLEERVWRKTKRGRGVDSFKNIRCV